MHACVFVFYSFRYKNTNWKHWHTHIGSNKNRIMSFGHNRPYLPQPNFAPNNSIVPAPVSSVSSSALAFPPTYTDNDSTRSQLVSSASAVNAFKVLDPCPEACDYYVALLLALSGLEKGNPKANARFLEVNAQTIQFDLTNLSKPVTESTLINLKSIPHAVPGWTPILSTMIIPHNAMSGTRLVIEVAKCPENLRPRRNMFGSNINVLSLPAPVQSAPQSNAMQGFQVHHFTPESHQSQFVTPPPQQQQQQQQQFQQVAPAPGFTFPAFPPAGNLPPQNNASQQPVFVNHPAPSTGEVIVERFVANNRDDSPVRQTEKKEKTTMPIWKKGVALVLGIDEEKTGRGRRRK